MFHDQIDSASLLEGLYREIVNTLPRGQAVKAEKLSEEYELAWCVWRNSWLIDRAEWYAARFAGLLSQAETFESALDRLHEVDQDYEKVIVTAEYPEDEEALARTSALVLLVMLFRRLEDRGVVRMWSFVEVADWLAEHAAPLGGKHGQLALF
jgi:hypothetical protein